MPRIRICLIASGGGTDANSVMLAYRRNWLLPEAEVVSLVSTVTGAGCLEKATQREIPSLVIARKDKSQSEFEQALADYWRQQAIRLVFLLGCIHSVPVLDEVEIYNIHPADPKQHGGKKMYGLAVHEHVLEDILDKQARGWNPPDGRWFTYPTVHAVTPDYDHGGHLLRASVEIPGDIINLAKTDLTHAAEQLQKLVLPCEHLMLPAAVNLACQRIIA